MKPIFRIAGAVIILFLMGIADLPTLSGKLVPEAQAFRGRGAAFVVGAAVGSAGSSSADGLGRSVAAAGRGGPTAGGSGPTAGRSRSATGRYRKAAGRCGSTAGGR